MQVTDSFNNNGAFAWSGCDGCDLCLAQHIELLHYKLLLSRDFRAVSLAVERGFWGGAAWCGAAAQKYVAPLSGRQHNHWSGRGQGKHFYTLLTYFWSRGKVNT